MENVVQDEIGHASYGLYAGLFSLGYLFVTLSDFGVNQYVTKKLAGEPDKLKDIFSNVFTFKLFLLIIYPAFMCLVGYFLGYEFKSIVYLGILSFSQAIIQLLMFLRANFQANQFFIIDSLASILDKIFLIGIVFVLLTNNLNLDSFIYGRLAAIAAACIVFYFVSIRLYGWIKPSLNVRVLKDVVKYSFPFALITVLYSMNDKVDQVMLLELAGDKITGLYAGAYRWYDAFMMYLWTVLPVFFARFAFFVDNEEEKQKIFNFGQIITALPMMFVSGFIFYHGQHLFFLFDNSSSEEINIMSSTMKILFIAAIANGFFAIYSTLLTSTGYEKIVSKFIVGSLVLNVVLNYLFIPQFGSQAAAWATVASTLFLSFSYLVLIHKKLPQNVPFRILGKLTLLFVLYLVIYYLLTLTMLEWYIQTIIAGLLLLVMAYIMGLLKLDEYSKTLQKVEQS